MMTKPKDIEIIEDKDQDIFVQDNSYLDELSPHWKHNIETRKFRTELRKQRQLLLNQAEENLTNKEQVITLITRTAEIRRILNYIETDKFELTT